MGGDGMGGDGVTGSAAGRRARRRTRLLVVGHGMAADRLLDELAVREALGGFDVTVVGEEPQAAYNRTLLTHVLTGSDPFDLATQVPQWYPDHGIRLVPGRWVQRLDTAARRAVIGDGRTIGYDVAVLATGSRPSVPPVGGWRGPADPSVTGVHTFRTMEDCLALRRAVAGGRRREVVVVGAGLLGLEAAKALCDLGHRVTVVHPQATLLNAQLDEVGGAILRASVEELGVHVVIGRVEALLHRGGSVEAVLLADQHALPADTVLFTTGVRPRIDVAAASGIEVDRGVIVDDRLATSAPGVHAIGECAEHDGSTVGLVAPCWEQAAVLADRLAGSAPDARYRPAPAFARLKVAGIEVASMGAVEAVGDDEVLQVIERRRGVYRKLVVRQGRLIGAVLVGDAGSAANLVRILDRGDRLPPNRIDLMCSPAVGGPADGGGSAADLCTCNRVSGGTVAAAIAAGCDTVESVGRATRAGTGCGSCVGGIRRLLGEMSACSVA